MDEIRDVLRAAKRRDPKAFANAEFKPVVAGDYKRAIAAGLVLGDPGAIGLKPLVGDKSGGYYLIWADGPIRSCIVYFGSAGQKYVAAASETELVSMLPYGAGVHDAMGFWFRRLTEPQTPTIAPEDLTPAAVEAHRTSGDPSDAWVGKMAEAVAAAGIKLEQDPLARIEAVNRAVLVPWLAVCERRFETQLVAADLERPARAYRASELFQIGERIEHPTFGDGVVEARTEPGKMTVFFKSGRKVLAQAKEPPVVQKTIQKRR
jgi:hypothetical protein